MTSIIKLKNFKLHIKGLNLFGIIITTSKQLHKAVMEADEAEVIKISQEKGE